MVRLVVLTCLLTWALPSHGFFTRHYSHTKYEYSYAECDMVDGAGSGITGTIRMRQAVGDFHPIYTPLEVEVFVTGLNTTDGFDLHGFHVHTYGDTSDSCKAAGGHYNPVNTDHGSPTNAPHNRHVGDWGNVAEENGSIKYKFTDYLSTLTGQYSIYGRAIVLHEGEDDLGKGGDAGSVANGNAGRRLACCVIRLVKGGY